MGEKSFLITGGNFTNKGAQSMLFTAISELRKRYPGCKLFVLPLDNYKKYAKYSFKGITILQNHPDIHSFDKGAVTNGYILLKNTARRILGRNYVWKGLYEFRESLSQVDCILDISGFCLSSQFPLDYNQQLLESIEDAKRNQIPIVLMPQSFGPFDYGKNQDKMMPRIGEDLQYPAAIFAREKGCLELLKGMGLTNVSYSTDLVLQSSGIDLDEIFLQKPEMQVPVIDSEQNAAVIPNSMNLYQGDKDAAIQMYLQIVGKLIELEKTVYILYHSNADRQLSKSVYDAFQGNDRVRFLDREYMCFEYDEIVKKMDFIVASRYHSIVHGYKNAVPSVILGWAEKYHSLAELFGQEEFIFDVRESVSNQALPEAIDRMNQNFREYKAHIKAELAEIQKANCFDVLDRIVK